MRPQYCSCRQLQDHIRQGWRDWVDEADWAISSIRSVSIGVSYREDSAQLLELRLSTWPLLCQLQQLLRQHLQAHHTNEGPRGSVCRSLSIDGILRRDPERERTLMQVPNQRAAALSVVHASVAPTLSVESRGEILCLPLHQTEQ